MKINPIIRPVAPAMFTLILLACLPASIFGKNPNAPAYQPLTVAVLDFSTSTEELKGKGEEAASLLAGLLTANENLVLVERAELASVLAESEMTLSGTVSAESAAKVGQLTGAKVLVTGRMFASGDENYLVTKVISAETGRVYGQTAKYTEGSGFGGAVESAARQISQQLAENVGELLAKTESADERIARLRKSVAGKTLQKVFVEIPEEHLTRRVPDPAAQTEIQKILQDVGYTLVTSSEAADVVIMNDDLRRIPETIRMSRRTRTVLLQNIVLALGVKAVFLVLAIFGTATMWMAIFADMGASLLVIFNGLRLLRMGSVESGK